MRFQKLNQVNFLCILMMAVIHYGCNKISIPEKELTTLIQSYHTLVVENSELKDERYRIYLKWYEFYTGRGGRKRDTKVVSKLYAITTNTDSMITYLEKVKGELLGDTNDPDYQSYIQTLSIPDNVSKEIERQLNVFKDSISSWSGLGEMLLNRSGLENDEDFAPVYDKPKVITLLVSIENFKKKVNTLSLAGMQEVRTHLGTWDPFFDLPWFATIPYFSIINIDSSDDAYEYGRFTADLYLTYGHTIFGEMYINWVEVDGSRKNYDPFDLSIRKFFYDPLKNKSIRINYMLQSGKDTTIHLKKEQIIMPFDE